MDMTDTIENPLPPREKLWEVVQEAHDYLKEWMTSPSARQHPTYGKILFNTSTWGEMVLDNDQPTSCEVCLAGLWYLQKGYGLLGGRGVQSPLADFLDDLRNPECFSDRIEENLGVVVPHGIEDDLVGDNLWEAYNPEHIIVFLDWLVQQRTTENSTEA